MKQSPQEKAQKLRLEPSKFSADGFLGNDPRPIDEIIATDLLATQKLGSTPEEIAKRLREVYQKAKAAIDMVVRLRPGVTAEYYESRGKIPSPFRGDGVFEKGEIFVKDEQSGETLRITALGIHLIEKHHFFQGRGSRYRIEPERVLRMLGSEKE